MKSSAQVIADGTTHQAASLEEVASSMTDVSAQSQENNTNATNVQELVKQTLDVVERGNNQMGDMLQSMDKINETSAKVTKVIKVIDEIAFQTNLLALNAAVEAARAGKYGKGFAVVAEEVRNLATRSSAAAKDTTELIEHSTREIAQGVKNADQTAEVLDVISSGVTRVNDLISEIAMASSEQVSSIGEINKGLEQVNHIVQQNSAVAEETAASAVDLSGQSTELKRLISQFKLELTDMVPAESLSVPSELDQQLQRPSRGKPQARIAAVQGQEKVITLDDDDFGKY
ncbi:methyl-accepting chemotaxis protein [bacterium]|nr:methyl-accepting chemotaxis protein [bacterium]